MTAERWREIERVFEALTECPADERETRLRQACGDDHALRREVDALLACDVEDDNLAVNAVQGTAESLARASSISLIGRRIGSYRVTRAIGQGGMGAVYEAVREGDDYEQQVAVKLLRGGIGTEADVRRFRRERQLLARLDHPNIARLLDGGATDDGLPYIVMEYVNGVPITQYARQNELSTEQNLRLFLQLCHAVQYAHQRLIVHRDIKPGNVLVTADGTPKLLDFGIARLTEPEPGTGGASPAYTTVRMLTPDYASPEQARGEVVTTASDIYSLGAVLYELVAGQVPSAAGARTDVPKPGSGAARRLLRGDLDNIVKMALRAEPDRRYTSVEQLAEDIRRYLDGRPVLARKDTIRYRTGKFLKRNRVPVAAGFLVAVSLIGGMIATTHQADRAQRRFEDVRKLAHTMLFDVNDKLVGVPATLAARVLLVDTATRYYDSLAHDAEGDQALQWELGQAYSNLARLQAGDLAGDLGGGRMPGLGRTADALVSLRKALAIHERLVERYGKPEYRQPLPILYYNIGMLQTDPAQAIPYMQKGLALARHLPGKGKRVNGPTSMLLYGLGVAQLGTGDPKAALATFRTPPFRPETIGMQPHALAAMGDLETAVAGLKANIAGCEKELAKGGPGLVRRIITYAEASQMSALASYLANPRKPNLGRSSEALTLVTRAIGLVESVAQRDPSDRSFVGELARAYRVKAAILADIEPAEAVQLCRKASAQDPGARAQSAYPLRKLGRTQEALQELTAAMADPLGDEDAILARLDLGDLRLHQGDRKSAEEAYAQALDIAQKAVTQKPNMMLLRKDLADCYERLGMWDKSLAVWNEWTRWGVSSSYDRNRKLRAEKMLAR